MFDDGSIESKVQEYELRKNGYNVDVLPVEPLKDKIQDWFTGIKHDDSVKKVYLHLCYEDFNDPKKYDELTDLRSRYPDLRIILYFESATRSSIKERAKEYGIEEDVKEITLQDKIEEFRFKGEEVKLFPEETGLSEETGEPEDKKKWKKSKK